MEQPPGIMAWPKLLFSCLFNALLTAEIGAAAATARPVIFSSDPGEMKELRDPAFGG